MPGRWACGRAFARRTRVPHPPLLPTPMRRSWPPPATPRTRRCRSAPPPSPPSRPLLMCPPVAFLFYGIHPVPLLGVHSFSLSVHLMCMLANVLSPQVWLYREMLSDNAQHSLLLDVTSACVSYFLQVIIQLQVKGKPDHCNASCAGMAPGSCILSVKRDSGRAGCRWSGCGARGGRRWRTAAPRPACCPRRVWAATTPWLGTPTAHCWPAVVPTARLPSGISTCPAPPPTTPLPPPPECISQAEPSPPRG